MDKDFWKGFLNFLDDAETSEIERRLQDTRSLLALGIRNPDVRADANRIVRFLEQELLLRQSRHT